MANPGWNYIQGLSEQLRLFLQAFGFGFLLGILYDVFRILRLALRFGKKLTFAADVFYVLSCTFFTFFYLLAANNGQLMAFILLGEALGWLVYYFSLGPVAIRVSDAVLRAIRGTVRFLSGLILKPIRFFFRQGRRFLSFLEKKCKKIAKKVSKKIKYYLKKQSIVLYNIQVSASPKKGKHKGKRRSGK